MEKIPTVFRRDPDDMKHVLPDVTPGCEWVLAGKGVPTRKWDGTCILVATDGVFARREVKPGKQPPPGFVAISTDENTGKTVGWEPWMQSPFARQIAEAVEDVELAPGTYELCGPKINGNPEGLAGHFLLRHGARDLPGDTPRDFDGLAVFLKNFDGEGIVWHHPDGRMAKLKKRDFA